MEEGRKGIACLACGGADASIHPLYAFQPRERRQGKECSPSDVMGRDVDSIDAVRQGLIQLLPRLRRLARALAGQVADADDLVQTVLERALARAAQWRPDAALDKWVFAIARNAWRDELRARGRSQNLFVAEEAAASVADVAHARPADRVELAAALAALPPDHREVVALVLVEGMSYGEAAELLEIPVGTVTSRLARARTSLQAHLGTDA